MALLSCGLWLDDEARIERARAALDNQQYSAAIIDLKTVLRDAPDNAVARKLLGRALAASGEFEAAETQLQRALEQEESLDDFRVAFAESLLATGQPERAFVIADPTEAADDKEAFLLWLYRGDAQAELGSTANALRSYDSAAHLNIDKATTLLRAAELYWGAENLRDAKLFTEAALLDDPGNLDAHLTLAAILSDLEDWQAAEERLVRMLTALQLEPMDRGYVLASLADVRLAQDDVTGSRQALEQVAELWPADDPDLLLLKGKVALAEGDNVAAATKMTAYLAVFPESELAMRMLGAANLGQGLFNTAGVQLARALAMNPDEVETRKLLARAHLAEGRIDQGRDVLEPVLELVPRDPVTLSLLGVLNLATHEAVFSDDPYGAVRDQLIRGEIRQALITALDAVSDNQSDPQGLNLLGLCQLASGDALAAVESISRALEDEPDNSRRRLDLARAHLGNATPEEGLMVLEGIGETEVAAEISTMRRALVIDLHESNIAMGRPDAGPLSRWLRENPDDYGARLLLAQTYIDADSFADAAAQYEWLLDQGLDDLVMHNNLAWSYLQLSDNRAREHAEYAYELAPNEAQIVDTLGWILVSQGDLEKGSSLLRDAHILQPGDPVIAYHLAYVLSRTGAADEAEAMLERLLERGAGPVGGLVGALLSEIHQGHKSD